jgi:hypothetical protein
MTDERQRSALKVLYDEVLLAFKEALDKAEDLISPKPGSHPRKVKTWLENATSSLISWGIDARTDAGSLSAVEGTPLENEVRCTLCELQRQLEKIYEERSFREEVFSLPEHATYVVPDLSPIPYGDGLAADEDPMTIMSSLIGVLQDTVRPIRMIHALRKQEGPYRDLKRQINDIYNQHIERRDRSELRAPESTDKARGSQPTLSTAATLTEPTNQPAESPSTGKRVQNVQRCLWADALQALTDKDKATIPRPGPDPSLGMLQNLCAIAEERRDHCENRGWKFELNGRQIILRDLAQKVVVWINQFMQVGDVVANADPIHVGLPWAGVRLLLQVRAESTSCFTQRS